MNYHQLLLLLLGWICINPVQGQSTAELMQKAQDWLNVSSDSSLHYYRLAERQALQTGPVDSLYSIYNVLLEFYSYYGDRERALYYAEEQYKHASSNYEKAFGLISLGQQFEYSSTAKSDSCYQAAELLVDIEKDSTLSANFYYNYGQFKLLVAEFYPGINYLLKATDYGLNPYATAQNYVKIAYALMALGNYELAGEYISRSQEICRELDFKYGRGMPQVVAVKIAIHQDDFVEAELLLDSLLPFAQTAPQKDLVVAAMDVQTELLIAKGDWTTAAAINQQALAYWNDISPVSKSTLLNRESEICLERGYYRKILANYQIINDSLEFSNPFNAQLSAANFAAQASEQLGEAEGALRYFKEYKAIEDTIFRGQQAYYFSEIEARYNRREQAQEIALLDSENALQTIQINQQRLFLTWGGIGLFTILGLVLFLAQSIGRIKQQNQLIAVALTEKDLLLREIHHRVKNNLQLVSSLLGLQSRYIDDPNAQEALRAGKARVKSMSLIHQDLYRKEELTSVSVREYFDKLCKELMHSYQINSQRIQLTTEIEDLDLDVDTLVPLGLIINELLTNAFKYAFPDDQTGVIQVALFEKDEHLHLQVADNGVGMTIAETTNSFGYKLIHTLVKQLEGEFRRGGGPGTKLYFCFHDYKKQ